MRLTLGFSPCPNDTFIFDALVNGLIDTGEISFDVILEDVQTLNEWAQQGRLDVSKVSYGVLPNIIKDYRVLESGGALGRGVGPLLISKYEIQSTKYELLKERVANNVIAIPGEQTTAHFLFSQAFPTVKSKVFLRFDEIEEWVAAGNGPGVIIHENRFTYAQKGLHKWADLGELWEQKTGLPIPLGGIVGKRTLPGPLLAEINNAIKKSLSMAWAKYPELSAYVKSHAQEMDESVMRSHIELYVNDFSVSMKPEGKQAIERMMQVISGTNTFSTEDIFL
jgi:1,4-dihydroxy-6-naphthoate synthase